MFDPKVLANKEATDEELSKSLSDFIELGGDGAQFVALLIGLKISHEQTSRLLVILEDVLGDEWEEPNASSE